MARSIFAGGRIDWNEGAIRILLSGPEGETSQDIQRRARAVQRRAQGAAPVRTGELRSSIHVNTVSAADGAAAEITADAWHALYVEFGRRPINIAGGSHWLNWISDTGDNVFAQAVERVPARHFMLNALDEAAN